MTLLLLWLFQWPSLVFAQRESIEPIPATIDPKTIATQILHRALHESVWGQPVACDVRQTISMFDRKITSFGNFVRGGQGSGKLRMSLQIPAGDQMNSLLQVSDGELLYTQQSVGKSSTRTRVDLGKVRERLVITTSSLKDPMVAMYLAIGGQAELLRKLCQQYEWTKVAEGEVGGIPVWWLSGSLTYRPPSIVANAEIDKRLFEKNESAFLPTHAQIAIGRSEAPVPYWLYQVDQRRESSELSPTGQSQQVWTSTEWVNPSYLEPKQLAREIFDANTTNDIFTEETRLYLPASDVMAVLPQDTSTR